jgi:predicted lysophospholipase L1 biosynthesis ABC-type transport system permease subunit
MLTESVVLAGLGGLLGLVISFVAARALLMLAFPDQHNMPVHAMPSPLVIGFAFGLSLATGILFGLAPALLALRVQPIEALRSNARTTAQGASYVQRGLVVLQAALSLVLLVAAGLFIQSLNKARGTDMRLMSIRKRRDTRPPKSKRSIAQSKTGSTRCPAWSRSASPLIRRWKTITGEPV